MASHTGWTPGADTKAACCHGVTEVKIGGEDQCDGEHGACLNTAEQNEGNEKHESK